MGTDYSNPAERFAEVTANRRVPYCPMRRTPTKWIVALPDLPIQARSRASKIRRLRRKSCLIRPLHAFRRRRPRALPAPF